MSSGDRDNIYPTLFNLYINKLANKYSVNIGGKHILVYADNIKSSAESENDLQNQLYSIKEWRKKMEYQ